MTNVGYDWKWYESGTGKPPVLWLTRRLHLTPGDDLTSASLQTVQDALAEGLHTYINAPQHPLPDLALFTRSTTPPELRVSVEFTTTSDTAHNTVTVHAGLPARMNQNTWFTDAHPAALVHEFLHGLGIPDDRNHHTTPTGQHDPNHEELTSTKHTTADSIMGPVQHHADPTSFTLTTTHLSHIAQTYAPHAHPTTTHYPTTQTTTHTAPDTDIPPAVDYQLLTSQDKKRPLIESHPYETLWHFNPMQPEHVFTHGVPARDTKKRVNLNDYVFGEVRSPFVSTTHDSERWHNRRRYRYEIEPWRNFDPTGVDMELSGIDAFPYLPRPEREVVFTARIEPSAIVRVLDSTTGLTGTWNTTTQSVEWAYGTPWPRSREDLSSPTFVHFAHKQKALSQAAMSSIDDLAGDIVNRLVYSYPLSSDDEIRIEVMGYANKSFNADRATSTSLERANAAAKFIQERIRFHLGSPGARATDLTMHRFTVTQEGLGWNPLPYAGGTGPEHQRAASISVHIIGTDPRKTQLFFDEPSEINPPRIIAEIRRADPEYSYRHIDELVRRVLHLETDTLVTPSHQHEIYNLIEPYRFAMLRLPAENRPRLSVANLAQFHTVQQGLVSGGAVRRVPLSGDVVGVVSGRGVEGGEVVVVRGVEPSDSGVVVAGLLALPGSDVVDALERMSPEHRRWLASDVSLVDGLRVVLPGDVFARVAARLLVVVPEQVSRPVSARREAYAQVTRMMQDSEVAARLLKAGAAVVVVPQDVALTKVSSFAGLHGGRDPLSGRPNDELRGSAVGLVAGIAEENLLGEDTPIGRVSHYADGYSTATHEIAHLVHEDGLSASDRALITRVYQEKRRLGPDVQWPDGIRRDLDGEEADNYSSTDEFEYFAQLTNAYLGVNQDVDKMTGRDRFNGPDWVRTNERELLPLLERLYGPDPAAVHDAPANPVTATTTDNNVYTAFRDFTHLTQSTPPQDLPAETEPTSAAGALAPAHPMVGGGAAGQRHASPPAMQPALGPSTQPVRRPPVNDDAMSAGTRPGPLSGAKSKKTASTAGTSQKAAGGPNGSHASQQQAADASRGVYTADLNDVIEAARIAREEAGMSAPLEGTRLVKQLIIRSFEREELQVSQKLAEFYWAVLAKFPDPIVRSFLMPTLQRTTPHLVKSPELLEMATSIPWILEVLSNAKTAEGPRHMLDFLAESSIGRLSLEADQTAAEMVLGALESGIDPTTLTGWSKETLKGILWRPMVLNFLNDDREKIETAAHARDLALAICGVQTFREIVVGEGADFLRRLIPRQPFVSILRYYPDKVSQVLLRRVLYDDVLLDLLHLHGNQMHILVQLPALLETVADKAAANPNGDEARALLEGMQNDEAHPYRSDLQDILLDIPDLADALAARPELLTAAFNNPHLAHALSQFPSLLAKALKSGVPGELSEALRRDYVKYTEPQRIYAAVVKLLENADPNLRDYVTSLNRSSPQRALWPHEVRRLLGTRKYVEILRAKITSGDSATEKLARDVLRPALRHEPIRFHLAVNAVWALDNLRFMSDRAWHTDENGMQRPTAVYEALLASSPIFSQFQSNDFIVNTYKSFPEAGDSIFRRIRTDHRLAWLRTTQLINLMPVYEDPDEGRRLDEALMANHGALATFLEMNTAAENAVKKLVATSAATAYPLLWRALQRPYSNISAAHWSVLLEADQAMAKLNEPGSRDLLTMLTENKDLLLNFLSRPAALDMLAEGSSLQDASALGPDQLAVAVGEVGRGLTATGISLVGAKKAKTVVKDWQKRTGEESVFAALAELPGFSSTNSLFIREFEDPNKGEVWRNLAIRRPGVLRLGQEDPRFSALYHGPEIFRKAMGENDKLYADFMANSQFNIAPYLLEDLAYQPEMIGVFYRNANLLMDSHRSFRVILRGSALMARAVSEKHWVPEILRAHQGLPNVLASFWNNAETSDAEVNGQLGALVSSPDMLRSAGMPEVRQVLADHPGLAQQIAAHPRSGFYPSWILLSDSRALNILTSSPELLGVVFANRQLLQATTGPKSLPLVQAMDSHQPLAVLLADRPDVLDLLRGHPEFFTPLPDGLRPGQNVWEQAVPALRHSPHLVKVLGQVPQLWKILLATPELFAAATEDRSLVAALTSNISSGPVTRALAAQPDLAAVMAEGIPGLGRALDRRNAALANLLASAPRIPRPVLQTLLTTPAAVSALSSHRAAAGALMSEPHLLEDVISLPNLGARLKEATRTHTAATHTHTGASLHAALTAPASEPSNTGTGGARPRPEDRPAGKPSKGKRREQAIDTPTSNSKNRHQQSAPQRADDPLWKDLTELTKVRALPDGQARELLDRLAAQYDPETLTELLRPLEHADVRTVLHAAPRETIALQEAIQDWTDVLIDLKYQTYYQYLKVTGVPPDHKTGFTAYLWQAGRTLPQHRYNQVLEAAEPAHRRALDEHRAQQEETSRLEANILPHKPSTWHGLFNGQYIVPDNSPAAPLKDPEAAEAMERLAQGTLRPRDEPYGLHQSLHMHLTGGSRGLSFYYTYLKDHTYAGTTYNGIVPVLLSIAETRSNNDYRWLGNGGKYSKGSPKLSETDPLVLASKRYLATRPTPAPSGQDLSNRTFRALSSAPLHNAAEEQQRTGNPQAERAVGSGLPTGAPLTNPGPDGDSSPRLEEHAVLPPATGMTDIWLDAEGRPVPTYGRPASLLELMIPPVSTVYPEIETANTWAVVGTLARQVADWVTFPSDDIWRGIGVHISRGTAVTSEDELSSHAWAIALGELFNTQLAQALAPFQTGTEVWGPVNVTVAEGVAEDAPERSVVIRVGFADQLSGVIAPGALRATSVDASMVIGQLWASDPQFFGRHVDHLIRAVLHLHPSLYTAAYRQDLLSLIYAAADEHARATGHSAETYVPGTVGELASFHLRHAGLSGADSTDSAVPPQSHDRDLIRDWASQVTQTLDLDVTWVIGPEITKYRSQAENDEMVPAPWAGNQAPHPFVVLADAWPGGAVLRPAQGKELHLTHEEFAQLLAEDGVLAQLPPDTAVVLAGSGTGAGGLTLPRMVAAATKRQVWSYSGSLSLMPDFDTRHVRLAPGLSVDRTAVVAGRWILSLPSLSDDLRPATEYGAIEGRVAVNGPLYTVPDSEVATQSIVDPTGLVIGRGSFTDFHWTIRDPSYPALGRLNTFMRQKYDAQRIDGGERVAGSEQPVPWLYGPQPYFFAAHGDNTYMTLRLRDDNRFLASGRQVGALIRRRPSVQGLHPDAPIVLLSCSTAARLADGIPGSIANTAQEVADSTRRTVFAPTTPVAVFRQGFPGPEDPITMTLQEAPDGSPGEWRKFRPEPSNATLEYLTRSLYYDGYQPEHVELTRTLVRQLRDEYGADIDRRDDFLDLLHSLAAQHAPLPTGFRPQRTAHGSAQGDQPLHTTVPISSGSVRNAENVPEEAIRARALPQPPIQAVQGLVSGGAVRRVPLSGDVVGVVSGRGVEGGEVVVVRGVEPSDSGVVVAGLLALPGSDVVDALERMSPEHRRWLASDVSLVDGLRVVLPGDVFARVAARLLVVVPEQVSRPVSARREAYAQVTRMMQDSEVAARLLKAGAAVVVVPQDVALTKVSSFAGLHGGRDPLSGRPNDELRGSAVGLVAGIAEENLLGEDTPIGRVSHYADGYSTATHEIAHLVHEDGLSASDRALITRVYQEKRRLGPDVQWPDGIRRDLDGEEADNYSSTDEFEYFAQLTNAYLGVNQDVDKMTGRDRFNGPDWVRTNERELLPLLERLYGPDPAAVHDAPANPVTATTTDNNVYTAFRDFTHLTQSTPPQDLPAETEPTSAMPVGTRPFAVPGPGPAQGESTQPENPAGSPLADRVLATLIPHLTPAGSLPPGDTHTSNAITNPVGKRSLQAAVRSGQLPPRVTLAQNGTDTTTRATGTTPPAATQRPTVGTRQETNPTELRTPPRTAAASNPPAPSQINSRPIRPLDHAALTSLVRTVT
ncbi:lonely Cys domain-containing protein, partial [Streptomyces sp. NPDC051664]|uniref:lonely Cys domain-containing protein n=1 Tax=Streptomyces sp. NPDC051664 TaxID=3365668 RepID=UPI00379946D3